MSANELSRFGDYRVIVANLGTKRLFLVQLKTDRGWGTSREFDYRTNAERHAQRQSKITARVEGSGE